MRVVELWRHPVKSLQGESLETVDVASDGVAFDRAWGVRSETTGRILTGRRRSELLLASAAVADGLPLITLPDGTTTHGTGPDTDKALSVWLGESVALVEAANEPASTGEFFSDATDDTSAVLEWTMPAGRFVDAMPLLVLTTSSLRAAAACYPDGDWSTRRFRPNVVLASDRDGWLEDEWLARPLTIGGITIIPRAACVRCTMVTRPQPGLERDLNIYKSLRDHHGSTFGVWCEVSHPGPVGLGDAAELAPH